MRVLWVSDSPTTPSGFGNVTRSVCAGLAASGHEVLILGWQSAGSATRWQGCTVLPAGMAPLGADVILHYLHRYRPEALITLADIWWLSFIADPPVASFLSLARIPWVLYYPLDADLGEERLPPSWMRILRCADVPVAMSRYGAAASARNGVVVEYIPHGVDTSVFRPAADRACAKRAMSVEGRFVVLSDARNQPRKLIPRTLEIFRRFARGKPDALLHLHCDPDDPAARSREYCYDLHADIARLGLEHQVRLTPGMSIARGLSLPELAAVYQAADVHLLGSTGEGFGLPTLQAAAAGVVPMASDYSASAELTAGHGESVSVKRFLSDEFGLRRALIDMDDAVARLDRLYRDRRLLAAKQVRSRAFAEPYDWSLIVPQWDALLRGIKTRPLQMREPAPTRTLSWLAGAARAADATAASPLLPTLPNGVRATVTVLERRVGESAAQVLGDAAHPERALTIPVALPPAKRGAAKARSVGLVHLAGVRDVALFRALRAIFPGLRFWSASPLPLDAVGTPGKREPPTLVRHGSAEYETAMAATVLALDLGGVDANLPELAAACWVPCVGPTDHGPQQTLWPELAVDDDAEAFQRARLLLIDQGENEALCALASARRERTTQREMAG